MSRDDLPRHAGGSRQSRRPPATEDLQAGKCRRRRPVTLAGLLASLLCLSLALAITCATQSAELGIEVPAGFKVEQFAGDDLVHNIYALTINAQGQVVVSGPDYIVTLLDQEGDGVADEARPFSDRPGSGAQGLLCLGDDMLCTGDNGLWRFPGGMDGTSQGKPERWAELRHPEHGAHGLIQGPDGWIYVICGNDAGVTRELAGTPRSPIKSPESGTLVRFSPDGRDSEIVAHGFRNSYDLDFGPLGAIYTVDSDGERDHHLPWYVPTRLFDIQIGQHHGWVNNGWTLSWSRPASFYDSVVPLATYGRGSPTGLSVYRHRTFPTRYRDGLFSCCWTMGRVYFTPLDTDGRPTGPNEVFLQTVGTRGFAPVDLAVGPSGALFVAIGGRGTQGGVFRIAPMDAPPRSVPADRLTALLTADQPLSAWSRAEWQPLAELVGKEAIVVAAGDSSLPLGQRVRD